MAFSIWFLPITSLCTAEGNWHVNFEFPFPMQIFYNWPVLGLTSHLVLQSARHGVLKLVADTSIYCYIIQDFGAGQPLISNKENNFSGDRVLTISNKSSYSISVYRCVWNEGIWQIYMRQFDKYLWSKILGFSHHNKLLCSILHFSKSSTLDGQVGLLIFLYDENRLARKYWSTSLKHLSR